MQKSLHGSPGASDRFRVWQSIVSLDRAAPRCYDYPTRHQDCHFRVAGRCLAAVFAAKFSKSWQRLFTIGRVKPSKQVYRRSLLLSVNKPVLRYKLEANAYLKARLQCGSACFRDILWFRAVLPVYRLYVAKGEPSENSASGVVTL